MTKKTKKTIILALLLCIISINSANSESPFRLIYKPDKLSHSVNQSFLQIFSGPSHTGSSLTHFPYQEDYKVFDKYGNMRVYNAFSTGLDGHWGATFYDFIRTMGTSFTSGGLFVLRHKSFFFIEQPTTNPQFTNHFVEWDLAEIVEPPDIWHQSMLRGFNVIADNNFETHYFYTTDAFLYKVKIDEPDKVVAKYAFNPTPAVSFPFANYKPILYHIYSGGTKRELWFVTHQTPTEIFRFDLITEEFTKYDGSNLPINISSIHSDLYPDEDPGYKIRNYFLCSDEKGNPFPVFVTYKAEKLSNGEYSFDNALLYYKYDYENHIWNWDTARIDLNQSPYSVKNRSIFDKGYPIYNEEFRNKVALSISAVIDVGLPATQEIYQSQRSFILYDFGTKSFESYKLPSSFFDFYGDTTAGLQSGIQFMGSYVDENDKKGIGIICDTRGYFIFFDPSEVSVEETESIFQELGIRSIYPNPVTQNRVSAEIWCWLADISTVELGLYDFMGQKVLDLSNQFEYEAATATISTPFEIPKSLAKGSYFLVVRSGKETRTKGIIVQ